MSDIRQKPKTQTPAAGAPAADTRDNRDPRNRPGGRGGRPGGSRGGGRPGGRGERQSEFAQKMISIRRVARVVAGGRRFSFSVTMVLGDKQGRVGVGMGKAGDTTLAIDKASRAAKRTMMSLKLTESKSIPYNISSKYCSSVVEIRPSKGRGLVAGSAVRTVLDLAGVRDVTAKLLSRSKNPTNNARAAMKALEQIAR